MISAAPEVLTDPAVVAAAVSTPIAALAAFVAGRFQGRGAYRGPVDAVRRQHQREAYAAFLAALWAYWHATRWDEVLRYTQATRRASGLAPDETDERMHAFMQLFSVGPDEILTTSAMVFLEGPSQITKAAEDAVSMVTALQSAAQGGMQSAATPGAQAAIDNYQEGHGHFLTVIKMFNSAAQSHLNSKK
ncbi:hypothetical protein AB0D90_21650 [Streptomyces althioticus]|uniref:hypothetical protein n=1 Tax=Streptomyces althioticus TaxID=83380 RepID=UPI0033F8AC8B